MHHIMAHHIFGAKSTILDFYHPEYTLDTFHLNPPPQLPPPSLHPYHNPKKHPSRSLHLSPPLVKRDIILDMLKPLLRLRIVPGGVLDLGLVGRHGIVGGIAFERTVRGCGGGLEGRGGYGGGWELVGGVKK